MGIRFPHIFFKSRMTVIIMTKLLPILLKLAALKMFYKMYYIIMTINKVMGYTTTVSKSNMILRIQYILSYKMSIEYWEEK